MKIVKKGYKSIYEEDALAYEHVAPSMGGEFKRHVRDGAGHYLALRHFLGFLSPLLGLRSFIFWSHRIVRWLAPFILIGLFIINILLMCNLLYRVILGLQIGFYVLAMIGYWSSQSKKIPLFLYLPFYFCNLNLALLVGFVRVVSGKQRMTWDSTKRVT